LGNYSKFFLIRSKKKTKKKKKKKKEEKDFFLEERGRKTTKDVREHFNMKIAIHFMYFDFLTMIFNKASLLDKNLFVMNAL